MCMRASHADKINSGSNSKCVLRVAAGTPGLAQADLVLSHCRPQSDPIVNVKSLILIILCFLDSLRTKPKKKGKGAEEVEEVVSEVHFYF